MSLRVWQLAVLAACLRLGSAERDPLPVALAELVKSGSVSSAEDLELLLLSDSVDVDPESYHGNSTNNRLPRSLLDAQPAQQALCKVRTEVMEVTRSMLDRSNAHFLLWPPCVEVQRCSGCCNTKNLKCVPVLTHTRYLQVMKIQYANKRPVYDKAVVSISDHVECRCQPAPRPTPRKKSPAHKQEVKHRTDAHELDPGNEDWSHNKTEHPWSTGHYHGDGKKYNGSSSSTRRGSSEKLTIPLPNHTEREKPEAGLTLHNVTRPGETQREKEQLHKDNVEVVKTIMFNHRLMNQTYKRGINRTEMNSESSSQAQTDQNLKHNDPPARPTSQTYRPAPCPKDGTNQKLQGNEAPETEKTQEEKEGRQSNSALLKEKEALEEEKEELLVLHKLLDEEKQKHLLKTQLSDQEKQTEHQPQHKHHHTYTTTQQTETTSALAKVSPPHPPARTHPRPPPRPPSRPSKKRRKQRNRISKAAMRAMLM
ncbi:uncharacterized protein pdgfbb isoform X2 [Electrophorus electricus]|uniref:uncharacterized protein pdgfbb isoform X2 n=1 Tax=Electrophorus electricus TaxID=8005 RepID=UPI0015D0991A|nr:uncharacterized protein pdgfbb isoform X2 [Electrophorus electricus]